MYIYVYIYVVYIFVSHVHMYMDIHLFIYHFIHPSIYLSISTIRPDPRNLDEALKGFALLFITLKPGVE
jgi:hypothetical protein